MFSFWICLVLVGYIQISVSLKPTSSKFLKFGHGLSTSGTTGQFLGNRTSTTQCAIFCSMPWNIDDCLAFERNDNQTCRGYDAIRNIQGKMVLGKDAFIKLPTRKDARILDKISERKEERKKLREERRRNRKTSNNTTEKQTVPMHTEMTTPISISSSATVGEGTDSMVASSSMFIEVDPYQTILALRYSTGRGKTCATLPKYPHRLIMAFSRIVTLLESMIVFVGGAISDTRLTKDVYGIDLLKSIRDWKWEAMATLPYAMFKQGVFVDDRDPANALIYSISGVGEKNRNLGEAYVYSTTTKAWSLIDVFTDDIKHSGIIEGACKCPGTNLIVMFHARKLLVFDLSKSKFIARWYDIDRITLLMPTSIETRKDGVVNGIMVRYLRHGLKLIETNSSTTTKTLRNPKRIPLENLAKIGRYAGYGQMAVVAVKNDYYLWNGSQKKFLKSDIQGVPRPVFAGLPWFSKIKCDQSN